MQDNPGGGVRSCRGCPQALQENFSFRLIPHRKRTRECCNRGSEVGQYIADEKGEGTVPPWKPKKSDGRRSCEKDLVSKKKGECA